MSSSLNLSFRRNFDKRIDDVRIRFARPARIPFHKFLQPATCNLLSLRNRGMQSNDSARDTQQGVKVVADRAIARDENSGPDPFGRTVAPMNHAKSLADASRRAAKQTGYRAQAQLASRES